VPLVLTEADRHLGIANRMLARRARRVCLAFPIPGREGDRYIVTGRPVPKSVLTAEREPARERFGISQTARCLLVFGGSQGARSINLAALDAFVDGPPRDYHVLHLSGRRDYEIAVERLEECGGADRHTLLAYEPGLGDALAASDLVLARAGGSIFEIAAAGKPAILVPYPYASGDHQQANAAWMAEEGAAVVLDDARLDGGALLELAGELFADPEALAGMAAASARLAQPDAAERVAAEILDAAGPG
jgi:UDP-N-acetylglucosamine--N-acetylmuramyl-(pentapeptide) pyrophosphoryl-undecaprenol N-acetylglucosamine transferase